MGDHLGVRGYGPEETAGSSLPASARQAVEVGRVHEVGRLAVGRLMPVQAGLIGQGG